MYLRLLRCELLDGGKGLDQDTMSTVLMVSDVVVFRSLCNNNRGHPGWKGLKEIFHDVFDGICRKLMW